MSIDIRHLVKQKEEEQQKEQTSIKTYYLFLKGSNTYVKGTLSEFKEAFKGIMTPNSVQAKLYRRQSGRYFDVLNNTEYQRLKRNTVFINITDLH